MAPPQGSSSLRIAKGTFRSVRTLQAMSDGAPTAPRLAWSSAGIALHFPSSARAGVQRMSIRRPSFYLASLLDTDEARLLYDRLALECDSPEIKLLIPRIRRREKLRPRSRFATEGVISAGDGWEELRKDPGRSAPAPNHDSYGGVLLVRWERFCDKVCASQQSRARTRSRGPPPRDFYRFGSQVKRSMREPVPDSEPQASPLHASKDWRPMMRATPP